MNVPDIDPELHGLLDEVVTDPRSALRRTPRRALLQWFGNPDSAHTRPIDATTAERHLVAVYRESLAEIFRESALSVYLRTPFRCHPWKDLGGSRFDLSSVDARLRSMALKAQAFQSLSDEEESVWSLLEMCSRGGLDRGANDLAQLSVRLAPSEFGRFILGLTLPRDRDSEAIGIFQTLALKARHRHRRVDATSQLAVRMVALDWLPLARDQYERALGEAPDAVEARCYAFNLACFLREEDAALEHSRFLEEFLLPGDLRLREAVCILREWVRTRSRSEVAKVLKFTGRLQHRFSIQALKLTEALT